MLPNGFIHGGDNNPEQRLGSPAISGSAAGRREWSEEFLWGQA